VFDEMSEVSGEQILEQAQAEAQERANMTKPRRVAVVGMGAVTAAGIGLEKLWDCLMDGRTALSTLPEEEAEKFGVSVVGKINGYDPLEVGFTKKESRRYALFVQYAMLASDEAMRQAGLGTEQERPDRFSCIFGSGIGGLHIYEHESVVLHEKGPKRVNPLFIPIMISNMAAGMLSIRYGLKGECTNIVTACATGTQNIGEAYREIRYGYADLALAGGTEESVAPMALAGFHNLGALSKAKDPEHASMPFDVDRCGFVAGEGAGAMVLEEMEHAKARGAHIIAELVGYGATGDAYHMTAPSPDAEGISRAMARALAEGGYTMDDVTHVNAHGTATHANDETEARAMHVLAGDAGSKIPITSIKGCTGHMLGGTGAVEAVVCARSVERGIVPATVGCYNPDPALDVNVVRETLTDAPQKVALSNSLGFGGHNAVLAFAPYQG
jgi:3-oxoacyl-[acyl-carrier-protein] synthase II